MLEGQASTNTTDLLWQQYETCKGNAKDLDRSARDFLHHFHHAILEHQQETTDLLARIENSRVPDKDLITTKVKDLLTSCLRTINFGTKNGAGELQLIVQFTPISDPIGNFEAKDSSDTCTSKNGCMEVVAKDRIQDSDSDVPLSNGPPKKIREHEPDPNVVMPKPVTMENARGRDIIFEFPYKSGIFFITRCADCQALGFKCNPFARFTTLRNHWTSSATHSQWGNKAIELDELINRHIIPVKGATYETALESNKSLLRMYYLFNSFNSMARR
ncbi:hypothetical protein GGR53DRAFT_159320 [Hypoxylon sp. FL1150]|nr:hypothetical protein GGR53DRAFT_159320 [Hypoxylon sp. FL1150]